MGSFEFTSGGNDNQVKFLVHQQAIPPLCALFTSTNSRIVLVALEGIENILRVGQNEAAKTGGPNHYAELVEECGGVSKLETLQQAENIEVELYEKAGQIVKNYFEGVHVATAASEPQGFNEFNPQSQEQRNFSF